MPTFVLVCRHFAIPTITDIQRQQYPVAPRDSWACFLVLVLGSKGWQQPCSQAVISVFLPLLFIWMACPLFRVGYWHLPLSVCEEQYLIYAAIVFLLQARVPFVWGAAVRNWNVIMVYFSFDEYAVSVPISFLLILVWRVSHAFYMLMGILGEQWGHISPSEGYGSNPKTSHMICK